MPTLGGTEGPDTGSMQGGAPAVLHGCNCEYITVCSNFAPIFAKYTPDIYQKMNQKQETPKFNFTQEILSNKIIFQYFQMIIKKLQ